MKTLITVALLLSICFCLQGLDTKILTQLAHIKSSQAFNIKFDHDLVYTRNANNIWVYSIFNPWSPKLEAGFYSPFPIEDMETHAGNHLFVASREPTNQILSVDSLYTGSRIFFTQTILGDKLTREGATMYVADRFKGIDIVNIGGGTIREIVSTFSEKWGIKDFEAQYPYIYALNDFGLVAVDITDLQNPRSIATNYQLVDATCMAKNANTLWVGAGKNLFAFNVTNPATPIVVTNIRMTNEIQKLRVKDNKLFVALGRGGVKIFDIANPLKAEDINNIFFSVPVYDISLANDYIFVGLGKEGWMIYQYR